MFVEDDGNLTVLEARNSLGELSGAVVTKTFKDVSGLLDNQTCYIDSVAVNQAYRNNHVATILMDKSIECSKGLYTDVFLASDNMAVQFELKNGYRIMDYNNEAEKAVINKLNESRGDYPDYITYMDKKLIKNTEPWYLRVYNNMIKSK